MLSRDPRKRPSARTLLQDPFFSTAGANTAAHRAADEATAARVAAQSATCVFAALLCIMYSDMHCAPCAAAAARVCVRRCAAR